MVKINEFHDMDIPKEIIPKPDYDVPSDLLIFMRNDPMFYRKNKQRNPFQRFLK